MKKILKKVIKNILIFFAGAASGAILGTVFFMKPLLEAVGKKQDVGLGIIAIAPVLFIIYNIIFAMVGGILAVITHNLLKYIKAGIRR